MAIKQEEKARRKALIAKRKDEKPTGKFSAFEKKVVNIQTVAAYEARQELKKELDKKPKVLRTIKHKKHPIIMNASYGMNFDNYKQLGIKKLKQRAKVDDVNNNYTHITYGGPTSSNTGATYANCIPITGTFNGCGADNIIVSSDSN